MSIVHWIGTSVPKGCAASVFRVEMDTAGSSETLVTIYRTTQSHIPEDCNLFPICVINACRHPTFFDLINVNNCDMMTEEVSHCLVTTH
jgi:hypothetical protein